MNKTERLESLLAKLERPTIGKGGLDQSFFQCDCACSEGLVAQGLYRVDFTVPANVKIYDPRKLSS